MAAIASIAPLLSAASSLMGAFQSQPSPTVYMPPQVSTPEVSAPPALMSADAAANLMDNQAVEAANKKRALILSQEGTNIDNLTSRFTPVNSQRSTLNKPTLLGQ